MTDASYLTSSDYEQERWAWCSVTLLLYFKQDLIFNLAKGKIQLCHYHFCAPHNAHFLSRECVRMKEGNALADTYIKQDIRILTLATKYYFLVWRCVVFTHVVTQMQYLCTLLQYIYIDQNANANANEWMIKKYHSSSLLESQYQCSLSIIEPVLQLLLKFRK